MPARRHRRKSSGPMVSKEEGLRIRETAARYSLMWGYQVFLVARLFARRTPLHASVLNAVGNIIPSEALLT